jgi:hypothetical protein
MTNNNYEWRNESEWNGECPCGISSTSEPNEGCGVTEGDSINVQQYYY